MFLSLGKFHPLNELEQMRRELSGVFDAAFGNDNTALDNRSSTDNKVVKKRASTPAIDIWELNDELLISAELPGVKKEDLELTLKENTLSIKADISYGIEAPPEARRYSERNYGSYERVLKIPLKVSDENVKATLKDGVLTIRVPKAIELQTKKIAIEEQ